MACQLETYSIVKICETVCFFVGKTLHEYWDSLQNINSIWTTHNVTSSHPEMLSVIWRWLHRLNRFGKGSNRTVPIWRPSRVCKSDRAFAWQTIFQRWSGSDSCSKLTQGPRSDILSSRHRTIGGTFRQMSAAIGRICKEMAGCMCVIMHCNSLLNKVFSTYIIWV